MKVCVFGAGAIGGSLAARLSNSGTEVSVVARGDHLTAIRQNGLTLILPERKVHVHIAASSDPRDLGPQDAVFVTVKAPALPDVAATIAPLLRADTPVVFCMNGVPWWYFYAHGGDDARPDHIRGQINNATNRTLRPHGVPHHVIWINQR